MLEAHACRMKRPSWTTDHSSILGLVMWPLPAYRRHRPLKADALLSAIPPQRLEVCLRFKDKKEFQDFRAVIVTDYLPLRSISTSPPPPSAPSQELWKWRAVALIKCTRAAETCDVEVEILVILNTPLLISPAFISLTASLRPLRPFLSTHSFTPPLFSFHPPPSVPFTLPPALLKLNRCLHSNNLYRNILIWTHLDKHVGVLPAVAASCDICGLQNNTCSALLSFFLIFPLCTSRYAVKDMWSDVSQTTSASRGVLVVVFSTVHSLKMHF